MKYNGRFAGWSDHQVKAFVAVSRGSMSGKFISSSKVHPRTLGVLKARRLVMTVGDHLILTDNGSAVAKSAGLDKRKNDD